MIAGIIVAVDVGEACSSRDFVRARFRFSKFFAEKHDGRAEFLAIADLDQRRELRHHHGRGNAEQSALIGERLRVIAGGGGDDASLFLLGRKLDEGVARAAFLETAGALEVIELAVNLHPGELAQRDRMRAGRFVDGAFDSLRGFFDVVRTWSRRSQPNGLRPGAATPFSAPPSSRESSISRTLCRELFGVERLRQETHFRIAPVAGRHRFFEVTGNEKDACLRTR